MVRASKVCNTPGCPNLQPCELHARKPWASSDRRSTLPADWPRVRNHVLKRDARICRLQLPGCTTTATEVHHLGHREDHRPEALVAACSACHAQVTKAQANHARRGGGAG